MDIEVTGILKMLRENFGRYLQEFQFRWNTRHETDMTRMKKAVFGTGNKRLTLKEPLKSKA